jgi:hypothetical protein
VAEEARHKTHFAKAAYEEAPRGSLHPLNRIVD